MKADWPSLTSKRRLGSLYLLALLPIVTEFLEIGSLPATARGWLTEAIAGLIIVWLVTWLRSELQRLEHQSLQDPLTGLGNRRAFASRLKDNCTAARKGVLPLSLLYMDVDSFKQINDDLGHAAGDEALRHVASAIRNSSRVHADLGFRLGGDEFALLMPWTDTTQSQEVLARIDQSCRAAGGSWAVGCLSVSGGIATYRADQSVEEFVQRADEAMRSQKAGRRGHPASRRVAVLSDRFRG